MSAPAGKLQGALLVASGATIRLTYDPTGAPATSDLVVAAGTLYRSLDTFLAVWEAQVEADIGGAWTFAVSPDNGPGSVLITTPGLNYSVTWSFAGDGTQIRNWCGEAADIVNRPNGNQFTTPHQMGHYVERSFQVLRRRETSRPRMQMITRAGGTRTQHRMSTGSPDRIVYDVRFWLGPNDALTLAADNLEQFLDDLRDVGTHQHFTLWHGSDSYFGGFADETVRIEARRVHEQWNDLWEVGFPFTVLETA